MVNQNREYDEFKKVSWLQVSAHEHGQRIDNFLFRHLKGVPKSRVYRILRKGEVRVNKGRVKPEYKLQVGDTLRLPPIRVAQLRNDEILIPTWVKTAILQVLFEDEALVVINKPAGLAVHGGTGLDFGLIEAMRQLRSDLPFLELVHRIDRETSGCVMLAKSRDALNQLHQQFRREQSGLEKSYLALVSGKLSEVKRVNSPLLQTRDSKGIKRVMQSEQGQASKSTFMPIKLFDHQQFGITSLARIQLHTGRMHQARVHAASIGLPILGDKVYGQREINRLLRSAGIKRSMLHAEQYQLRHPSTNKVICFKAPLPTDFDLVIGNLNGHLE